MPLMVTALGGVLARAQVPTIAILEWTKRTRVVSFRLEVPGNQSVVTITSTLTSPKGQVYTAMLHATNANAVTGMQLPPVPNGKYTLTVRVTDSRGGTASATRLKVEVTS